MTNGYLLEELHTSHSLKTLANKPIRFKNPENPMPIYHILTTTAKSFHLFGVHDAVLSDFSELTLTVSNVFDANRKPKFNQYRDFNHIHNALFRGDLLCSLGNLG